jgi:hypothetical protein
MKKFITAIAVATLAAAATFATDTSNYVKLATKVPTEAITTALYYEPSDSTEVNLSDYTSSKNPYSITLDDNALASAGSTKDFILKASGNQTSATSLSIGVTATSFYTTRSDKTTHEEQAVSVQYLNPSDSSTKISTPTTVTLPVGYQKDTHVAEFYLYWAAATNPDAGEYQSDVTVTYTAD